MHYLMWLVLVTISGLPLVAQAIAWQPLLSELSAYRVHQTSLSSVDKQRHYQVTVVIPDGPPPKSGYPVGYFLDGSVAWHAIKQQGVMVPTKVVWVFVGYEQAAQQSRTFDYTPPLAMGRLEEGGAEQFWQWLEYTLKPLIADQVSLDSQQQTLWGHSYGGLFTLYTLFKHPESFQRYFAVDPSLWWEEGALLNWAKHYQERTRRPTAQVMIQHSASHRDESVLAPSASRDLAQQLSQLPELTVQYHDFFNHHHGSVRAASLPAALRFAADLP